MCPPPPRSPPAVSGVTGQPWLGGVGSVPRVGAAAPACRIAGDGGGRGAGETRGACVRVSAGASDAMGGGGGGGHQLRRLSVPVRDRARRWSTHVGLRPGCWRRPRRGGVDSPPICRRPCHGVVAAVGREGGEDVVSTATCCQRCHLVDAWRRGRGNTRTALVAVTKDASQRHIATHE